VTNRTALVALGSNKGFCGRRPEELVGLAAEAFGALGRLAVLSPLYRSPAWPDPREPAYVNAAARFETALEPEALLAGLQAIEAAFGRVRSDDPEKRYAPRTLDLDLLALGGERRGEAVLTLPHPRIAERDFVLLPLLDVAPEWRHPVIGQDPKALLAGLSEVTATRIAPR
jgi:2-amino-4-hydroxy-6-hydroxymethyldihydropteridine diphosphokinase